LEIDSATFHGIEPGKYSLRIMLPHFDPVEKEITVKAGQAINLPQFQLQRSKGSLQLNASIHHALLRATHLFVARIA
jgi:hypothetical protein